MSHTTTPISRSTAAGASTPAYARLGLIVVGTGMLWWTAYIHLRLYATGFDNIPTIGRLFLAQGIAAAAVGVALLATRRNVVCLLGAALLIATVVGFVWTDLFGLFGFDETFSEAYAGLSLVVEAVGAVALVAAVLAIAPDDGD